MFVSSNLAISLDGKIATASRELVHLGTPADRAQMQLLRKRADVLIMGAGTLRTYRAFCGVRGATAKKQIANAILSTNLQGVDPSLPFFSNPTYKRLLFLTQKLSRKRALSFEESSEIHYLDPRFAVAESILQILQKKGYRKLLVEGGGALMWDFASLNLIDEYHVTLTPKIIGGKDAPTLVEGSGFAPKDILGLKLVRSKKMGDELYLTYRSIKSR